MRTAPAALRVESGKRTWPVFADLVRRSGARGNLIPDALLGAQTIEQGATLVTVGRGLARYYPVALHHPLD